MDAICDNLPAHLSPMDEMIHPDDMVYPVSMCGKPIHALDSLAYQSLYFFLQKSGSQLSTCDYVAQVRDSGRILVRPLLLDFFHTQVRPLTETEINYFWILGRNNLLTIDEFMRFCSAENK